MHASSPHICALIPTYNNSGTIVDIIHRTHSYIQDIIVVVDGCTDNTLALLQTIEYPIVIVSYVHNKGKGYALKQGLRKAIELGYEYALTIDSDGQHYPEDIPLLVSALALHPHSLIVGSRNLAAENMPGKNQFANKFSNFWFRLQTHVNLPDTQTGMRIYPIKRLKGIALLTSRYEAELELLVFAAWHNIPLIPVPIRVYYPPKEERISHFRPAVDFTRISILNTVLCVGAIVYGYPMMYWRTIYSFGIWAPAMLCIIEPLSLVYFLLFGHLKKAKLYYRKFIAAAAAWCVRHIPGLHVTINNPLDHKFGEKPMVYICNHQSILDVIVLFTITPKLIVLTKGWVWHNPLLGIVLRLSDCLPITKDREKVIQRISKLVQDGYSVLIFPEGTRTQTGEIGRFHRGACYIAEQLHLDMCPLFIRGMFDVMSRNEFRIRPGQVTLDVLPVITTSDTSFGVGYRQRTKSIELHYTNLLRKSVKDTVCVIGGGVGGLFTAALLAEVGYVVTVLEQLPVCGGGMYSYQRLGYTWQTGTHVLCGLAEDEPIGSILKRLGISVAFERTTFDHSPQELIGEAEWKYFASGAYRLTDGAGPLVQSLCTYITRHGGRLLTEEKVKNIHIDNNRVCSVSTDKHSFVCGKVVSSLHPKQLLRIVDGAIFRPITTQTILSSAETQGVFKLHIVLKEESIPYDTVTHYIPDKQILFYTSYADATHYARTMECIMSCSNEDLAPWKENRQADYAAYEAYKEVLSRRVIDAIEAVIPNIKMSIDTYFSATSLTYRDDYLTPEGAMYGMQTSLGRVTTRIPNLFLTGQNCYLHGICGTVYTAVETVKAIQQYDQ